jgi:hypothetical protein
VLDFKTKKHNLKTQCLITLFLLQSFDLYFWILQFNIYCFGTLWISNPNPTAIGSCAYYFDNKASYPSITGLAAYIGLSINPQSILSTNFYEDSLKFSAMGLGVAFGSGPFTVLKLN